MERIARTRITCTGLPGWVPDDVRTYLDHTVGGEPIRALARLQGCHASTILRRVQKTESRRDDPLVDAGLTQLGRLHPGSGGVKTPCEEVHDHMRDDHQTPDDDTLNRDAARVLRALLQPGALLAVVPDVETAVVVRESADGRPRQVATLPRLSAEAMAVKGWIESRPATGRVARYRITPPGRQALNRLMAERESARAGFCEAPAVFDAAPGAGAAMAGGLFGDAPGPHGTRRGARRPAGGETPIQVLARRRDKHGKAYLTPELVEAAERLRLDYELARMDGDFGQGWAGIMTGTRVDGASATDGDLRRLDAAKRLRTALTALGPELGEMALITCCQDQGMEQAERVLAMPARAGKYVLRIGLQMLARHYREDADGEQDLIY